MVFLEQFTHFLLFLKIVPAYIFFFLKAYFSISWGHCRQMKQMFPSVGAVSNFSSVSCLRKVGKTSVGCLRFMCLNSMAMLSFSCWNRMDSKPRSRILCEVNCEIKKRLHLQKDRCFSNQTPAYIRRPTFFHPSVSISCQSIKEWLPCQSKESCQNSPCSDWSASGQ